MAISSQLPQIVSTVRPDALQALALQAGQVLEAKVIGPAPNGGTQVQIAGQLLNLLLPMLAGAGETLQLQVQGTGAQLKLALQPNTQTQLQSPFTPPLPPPPASMPMLTTPVQPSSTAPVTAGNSTIALRPALPQAMPAIGQTTTSVVTPPLMQTASTTPLPAASVGQAATAPSIATPVATTPTTSAPPSPIPDTTVLRPGGTPYPTLASPAAQAASPAASLPQSAQTSNVTGGAMPTSSALAPTPANPQNLITQPAGPQAALTRMVQAALPRQASVGLLMSALSGLAGKVTLPEPVVRAVQQLLAAQLPLGEGKLDGPAMQKAVLNSGLFQEAKLATGQAALGQIDQKSLLLALRQTLVNWLGPQPQATPVAPIPPPMRGQVPRARFAEPQPIEPGVPPQETGKRLLEHTEAALSRLRLHQNAALPDPVVKTADWSMDLPVLVGQQHTVLHLQIHRDTEEPGTDAPERGWQMRFALSLPQLGEVGAQVSLRGGTTGVMLWAVERHTSEALEAHMGALRQTLAEVGLRPGAIVVRHGEPPAPVHSATNTGRFLDART